MSKAEEKRANDALTSVRGRPITNTVPVGTAVYSAAWQQTERTRKPWKIHAHAFQPHTLADTLLPNVSSRRPIVGGEPSKHVLCFP
jgi:hypothetical protein